MIEETLLFSRLTLYFCEVENTAVDFKDGNLQLPQLMDNDYLDLLQYFCNNIFDRYGDYNFFDHPSVSQSRILVHSNHLQVSVNNNRYDMFLHEICEWSKSDMVVAKMKDQNKHLQLLNVYHWGNTNALTKFLDKARFKNIELCYLKLPDREDSTSLIKANNKDIITLSTSTLISISKSIYICNFLALNIQSMIISMTSFLLLIFDDRGVKTVNTRFQFLNADPTCELTRNVFENSGVSICFIKLLII